MKQVLFLLAAVLFTVNSMGQEESRGYIVKVGDMAPDFEMELISGESVKLSDLQGKLVMLQFTASWCGVCRKEMPHIEADIWQLLKDREDFALLAIDRDEPAEVVKEYTEKVGTTYPIGLDPEAAIFELYAEKKAGITRNVIIDREGKIIFLTRLYEEEEFEAMKKVIFQELGE